TELATLIRPCGYFNAKARKLKALAEWLGQTCSDDPVKMSATSLRELRLQLLTVHGIGEETADSIILYAANKPIFVIDAYTRRIIDRIGLAPNGNSYSAYQSLFMENLPHRTALFNEYHALLVHHGKKVCRQQPRCPECCLRDICQFGTKSPLSLARKGG
ncbi:MAG: endonuclease, partial [Dehalococcoidales bacterium]|nr:endonuclease [Dehalococcoidales bacterium]